MNLAFWRTNDIDTVPVSLALAHHSIVRSIRTRQICNWNKISNCINLLIEDRRISSFPQTVGSQRVFDRIKCVCHHDGKRKFSIECNRFGGSFIIILLFPNSRKTVANFHFFQNKKFKLVSCRQIGVRRVWSNKRTWFIRIINGRRNNSECDISSPLVFGRTAIIALRCLFHLARRWTSIRLQSHLLQPIPVHYVWNIG